jgi:hypothetical protein
MFFDNAESALVIPQGSEQEDEHDQGANHARRDRQPRQERVH